MTEWLGLAGRPALVVGAGGLGGASAVALAALGARVVVVDRDEDNLDSVVAQASALGADLVPLVVDVASPESSRAAVEKAAGFIGTPEVFLHAIGRNERRPVLELGDDDWQSILTLNLSTAWWLGQHGRDRGDEHHPAVAGSDHPATDLLAQPPRRRQVEGQDRLPVVVT